MRRKLRLGLLVGALFSACCLPAAGAPAQPASSWTTFGASTARLGQAPGSVSGAQLSRRFVLPLSGQITAQVLESAGTFIATSSGGDVVAFDRDGFVRWRTNVGQLAISCPQLNGYGVVGTGVIDPASGTLYVADAFGRLHALSLATGDERRGWPIRVFSDLGRELDWGALTLAEGSVYVPTAAYCDADGTPGGIYRVDLATKSVSRWLAVPLDEGGGGGPWGWGGLAYDPVSGSLFAGSSGAFQGGTNSGASYTETAGFGDRLLEFAPGLQIRASSHPAGLPDRMDLDFVGSPLLVSGTSCGTLVVAATKNDTVYGWSEGNLAQGWTWKVAVEPYTVNDPFVAQLAWSAATSSVYTVTGTELVRIKIGASCKASVVWRRPLRTHTENGSPTVAGNSVWFADNGTRALVDYDATTGKRLLAAPLGGTTLAAPTMIDGLVVVGSFDGIVEGFGGNPTSLPSFAPVRASSTSSADAEHAWQSRANGVYATDNGGKQWRRIYPQPALAVLRVSATQGVLSLGFAPGVCMCATRQLWTADGGRTWHDTRALSDDFAGNRGRVYFWEDGTLRLLAPLPAHASGTRLGARTIASVRNGTIVAAVPFGGAVAALVSNRIGGHGWDNAPRVLLVHAGHARLVTLPGHGGNPLARSIEANGRRLTVSAVDYTDQPPRTITWTSTDAGATWSIGS